MYGMIRSRSCYSSVGALYSCNLYVYTCITALDFIDIVRLTGITLNRSGPAKTQRVLLGTVLHYKLFEESIGHPQGRLTHVSVRAATRPLHLSPATLPASRGAARSVPPRVARVMVPVRLVRLYGRGCDWL